MIDSKIIQGNLNVIFKCGCIITFHYKSYYNSYMESPESNIYVKSFTLCKQHKHLNLNNPLFLAKLFEWIYEEVKMTDYSITDYEELFDHYDEINAEMSLNDYLEEIN